MPAIRMSCQPLWDDGAGLGKNHDIRSIFVLKGNGRTGYLTNECVLSLIVNCISYNTVDLT